MMEEKIKSIEARINTAKKNAKEMYRLKNQRGKKFKCLISLSDRCHFGDEKIKNAIERA